jgi:AraC-like DNA-binding protein
LALFYLGWGRRDFARDPLGVHVDRGTNYYVVLQGQVLVTAAGATQAVRGPTALIFPPGCAFGIAQAASERTEILVWIWRGQPQSPQLLPPPGGFLALDLGRQPLDSLLELHARCRNEVSRADTHLPRTLGALRELLEVEILRLSRTTAATGDVRWKLANSWMLNNLAIHAPVPALCDYLCMSPSTLHRFFRTHAAIAPGAYFRRLKTQEALRLIRQEGWLVKAAAYHLGYHHPNDLSRTLAAARSRTEPAQEL